MRRISTSFRVLAIIGVLLHAGLIVWHNAAMLGATLQHQSLVSALTAICHGAGASDTATRGDLPELPPSSSEQAGCPICKGQVGAVAILSHPEPFVHRPHLATAQMEIVSEIIARRIAHVRPPTRAPPFLA